MSYTNQTTKQTVFGQPRNPEVVIGNSLVIPSLGTFTRNIFTRIQYAGEPFFIMAPGKEDVFLTGQNGFFIYPLAEFYESASDMPTFLTKEDYSKTFKLNPTAFLTAQKSLMPKLFVPSQLLMDNGIEGSISTGVFSWQIEDNDTRSRCGVTTDDTQSSVVLAKGKGNSEIEAKLTSSKTYVPQSITDIDKNNLIGAGAFQMVISIFDPDIPSRTARSEGTAYDPEGEGEGLDESVDDKIQPKVIIRVGDLEISIDMDGKCVGTWLTGEKNSETINLVSGPGEECIPQYKAASTDKNKAFVLTVYPLWDGVVIQSGVQTGKNIISASAAYIPVLKKASIFDFARMRRRSDGTEVPFDPENPNEIFIKTKKGELSTVPRLGDSSSELLLKAKNCSCSVAYSPIYFTKHMKIIHALVANSSVNGYTYRYYGFPIWTNNDTDYATESTINFSATGDEGPAEFTEVYKSEDISLVTDAGDYQRWAGEIFGEIVMMVEQVPAPPSTQAQPYNNGISNWDDYITSASISLTLDSNSGSVTFDKYGATGGDQTNPVTQHVGIININAKGGYNTNANSQGDDNTYTLFKGYTMEATESSSNNGCEVTVSLIGVEKRLDDIQLINPPIFDGYKFVDVASYICKFAGVAYDLASADQDLRLQISTDPIETVCFNWTTGLICRQALDEICKDTAHGYVTIDGVIKFFQRGQDGKPNYRGTSWGGFGGTNIQTIETSPNFDNLRNQIVLIGMRKMTEDGQKNFPNDFPVFPITTIRKNNTTPVIPWPKRLCYTIPGFPSQKELDAIADKIAIGSNYYEILGSTTIPGTNVKPLDIFLGYIVIGVTHNIDLIGKSWTTTLQLQKD